MEDKYQVVWRCKKCEEIVISTSEYRNPSFLGSLLLGDTGYSNEPSLGNCRKGGFHDWVKSTHTNI